MIPVSTLVLHIWLKIQNWSFIWQYPVAIIFNSTRNICFNFLLPKPLRKISVRLSWFMQTGNNLPNYHTDSLQLQVWPQIQLSCSILYKPVGQTRNNARHFAYFHNYVATNPRRFLPRQHLLLHQRHLVARLHCLPAQKVYPVHLCQSSADILIASQSTRSDSVCFLIPVYTVQ